MSLNQLKIYLKVWHRLTKLQFQTQVANARGAAIFLMLGKLLRFAFAFVMLWVVVGQAKVLAGYTLNQAIFVLALCQWGSTITQLFFRGVYLFRDKVKDGSFDFYLLSPLDELFYSLFSATDPIDLLMVIPYTTLVVMAWINSGYPITPVGIINIICSLAILMLFIFAIHVLIVAIGVKYMEVDNTIMLYRDLEKMAAFPIDIYGKYVGSVLTYLLPFAILATIPAKLIFGWASPAILLILFLIALGEVYLALRFWHRALQSYSSASS